MKLNKETINDIAKNAAQAFFDHLDLDCQGINIIHQIAEDMGDIDLNDFENARKCYKKTFKELARLIVLEANEY